jgi:hypothetical protein
MRCRRASAPEPAHAVFKRHTGSATSETTGQAKRTGDVIFNAGKSGAGQELCKPKSTLRVHLVSKAPKEQLDVRKLKSSADHRPLVTPR